MMRQKSVELDLRRQIELLSIKNFHAENEIREYKKMVCELRDVLDSSGPVPSYHYHVVRKHRSEWPLFWQRVDKILEKIK